MERTGASTLRAIPFFAMLSDEDLEGVLQVGQTASFEPGEVIVEQGTPGDAMFVVLGGAAEVDVGGRFHRLDAGDFFGEMALITAKRRTATVKAVEPVEALRIPAEGFNAFLLAHPAIAVAMLRAVVERLGEVQARLDAWMGNG
jgi:monovalent cation:H+ antiporter-2, CPA2 family